MLPITELAQPTTLPPAGDYDALELISRPKQRFFTALMAELLSHARQVNYYLALFAYIGLQDYGGYALRGSG